MDCQHSLKVIEFFPDVTRVLIIRLVKNFIASEWELDSKVVYWDKLLSTVDLSLAH